MDYSKSGNIKRRKNNRAKGKKVQNKVSILVFRVVLAVVLIGGFAGVGALVGAYLGILENTPKLDPITVTPSIYPSVIYYEDGVESDRLKGEENRQYVTFDNIPQNLKDAFVAIEDERFYAHNGVDLRGMVRAVYTTVITKGERKEGASTITQQLIKNNVRKISKNTITTKLQEQYMAVEYEKKLMEQFESKEKMKDYILELYMNSINMHYRINGVQTASMYYFNKPVSELNLTECAVIAAITQNPANNAPIAHPDRNKARATLILNKMLELSMIDQTEHDEAMAELEGPVYDRVSTQSQVTEENNSIHSYFNDALINNIVNDLVEQYKISTAEAFNLLYNGGLSIYSTQDREMQKIMDTAFMNDEYFPKSDFEIDVQYSLTTQNTVTGKTNNLYKSGTVKTEEEIPALVESFKNELMDVNDTIVAEKVIPIPQPQAAMVIEDFHNGHVKALTGGRGEKMANLALNRAVDSTRQPGSVFKVLASYAPSIDLGVSTAATVIEDSPFELNGWSPRNWYGGYRGLSTVRQGIYNSMNVVTVKNMYKTGVDACFQYLLNFGFTTLVDAPDENGRTDRGLATCLGGLTRGVTQLEVTAAYGTMANLGVYEKPVLYTRVLNHDGTILLENVEPPRQVLKAPAAYILTDMMKDVITKGTGGKARFQEINMPLAGKTGTTTDTLDLTFVGYTPYYVAGIWLGYDMPKTIHEDRGYHMILWRAIMEEIHKSLPTKEFERPAGVISATVCGASGKLAVPGLCSSDSRGNMVRSDIFMAGTQTSESCDLHVSATYDTSTGMKAGPYCPEELTATVIGVVKHASEADDGNGNIDPAWVDGPECTVHTASSISGSPSEYYIGPDGKIHTVPKPDLDFFGPTMDDDPLSSPGTAGGAENPADTTTGPPTDVIPSQAPVPEYSPRPIVTPVPGGSTSPTDILPPDMPTMDDTQSMDNFTY